MIKPCPCNEYLFEHTALNGQCQAKHYGPICGKCEKPCPVGIDDDYCYSKCCTVDVYTCPDMVEEYLPEHVFENMDDAGDDYIVPRGRVLFGGIDDLKT